MKITTDFSSEDIVFFKALIGLVNVLMLLLNSYFKNELYLLIAFIVMVVSVLLYYFLSLQHNNCHAEKIKTEIKGAQNEYKGQSSR